MKQARNRDEEEKQYTSPAVIYDGTITTRAGSPLGGGDGNGVDGIDPVDLFGD
jgi:hypothetical protein